MEAKANPKAVGAFVVGAVLLAVAVAAVFGGGRATSPTGHDTSCSSRIRSRV